MELEEAGRIICSHFKAVRPKIQAESLKRYKSMLEWDVGDNNLIIEPMVYFNLYMEDEFSHNYWSFLEMLKTGKVCEKFNPYASWFLWDKEKAKLLSAMQPYDFLPYYNINLLKVAKKCEEKEIVDKNLYDATKKEEREIPLVLYGASEMELDEAWSYLTSGADIW